MGSRASRRMTGEERRQQLIEVARGLFAKNGFDATTVEEIAARAGVSKPVVYGHFGGKEGLYAVVVDREVSQLVEMIRASLSNPGVGSRGHIEQAALTLLTYIEDNPDGFRIVSRDNAVGGGSMYASILSVIAAEVEDLLAVELKRSERSFDSKAASMYAQALVGMVALTGQWWLDARKPSKEEVAGHLVNLAWNGLHDLEGSPQLRAQRKEAARRQDG